MSDLELDTLLTFLNELDINELFDGEVTLAEEDVKLFSSTYETCIVSTTSEEVSDTTSGESSDESVSTFRPSKRIKTEEERKRQRAYDKKSRAKRTINLRETCEAFTSRSSVNPMILFITVLVARIEGTTRASSRLRLCASMKDKTEDNTSEVIDRNECKEDAKRQLAWNQVSINYSKVWTDVWHEHKTGKFAKTFLKKYSNDIQPAMNRLEELREELCWADRDLQQCMLRKTGGVWV